MNFCYTLNESGRPIPQRDFKVWARWFERTPPEIATDQVGQVRISTCFLGLGIGPSPKLWETMVFGGKLDQGQWRCAGNREQAEAMHREVLELVTAAEVLLK